MDMIKLGWREWVALPDLGIARIKAKVDTGARTSALHAFFVEPLKSRKQIRFGIHTVQNSQEHELICVAEIVDDREVTDSGGHTERRWVIRTPLVIGTINRPVEITLTNRDTMKFRMLLGRSALAKQFIVDPSRSYLAGKPQPG
jgi:hypothetical protein